MIIRVDVFKMPILHAKSLWDYAKLDKAQSFIEMSCMDVGCDNGIKLQDAKAMSLALEQAVTNQLFPNV